jgi:tetratricopeptide (TPR) repeat protein
MEGRFDRARQLLATSSAAFDELGLSLSSTALLGHDTAWVELLAGNPTAAEGTLRTAYAVLEQMGDRSLLSTTAAYLAQALLAQRRDEEAERFADISNELAAADDLLTQMLWRGVQGRILARRGRIEEAERLAREAVDLAARTDFVNHRGDALIDHAIVLGQAGRIDKARAAFAEGLRLYEQKGNVVAAEKARVQLAELATT